MSALPETILQFGLGRFLRAFADLFVHHANELGQAVGRVVVVQSTGDERATLLNRAGGRYHVRIRGLWKGSVVDRIETVTSISRALVAANQWDEIRAVARIPSLRVVLSNTTEAGYELNPADRPDSAPPRSFPAKLLAVLRERFETGQPGLTIVPCELQEHNADLLQGIVLKLAREWGLAEPLQTWLRESCSWHNTLVDRIVTDPTESRSEMASEDLISEALMAVGEPYGLWAIQQKAGATSFLEHPHVVWTPDVQPYFLRKVRILNGAHTALLIKAWPRGLKTVREAVLDPELGPWLERILFEEIVPTVAERVDDAAGFARQTLERFKNPFLEHLLANIAKQHAAKVAIRLVTTRDEFRAKFGRTPPLLEEVLTMPQPG
jgi:tagaturonate reductase